jgi:hypothetical protein
MAEIQQEITLLLERMALFDVLTAGQRELLVADLNTTTLGKGENLFSEGDEASSFFIILSGKIRITRTRDGNDINYATFVSGDHFGEEELVNRLYRQVTATALEPTRLLYLNRIQFDQLLERHPQLKRRISVSLDSMRLARQRNVDWLGEEETIYLFLRKDKAYLFISLIPPVLLAWLAAGILYASFRWELGALGEYSGLILLGISLLWVLWNTIDWSNDYYIVTNERVIWLEKVIALYESRQEAPLDTVLTVGLNTDLLGRILHYGDVRVKTFTGQIVMPHIGLPEYMLAVIEKFVSRMKQRTKQMESIALENAIRQRIGLPAAPEHRPKPLPRPHLGPTRRGENPFRFLVDIFKVRIEQDGMVTYRKHWLLLVKRAWVPSLLLLALVVLLIGRVAGFVPFLPVLGFLIIWLVLVLILFGWWLYEYIDWRNDIYQITEEHIVDIYRKPLGEVDKKTAPLENILSLHHEQTGIIRLILNYGDVVAMVGSAQFTFDGVYNPGEVVQDIFLRMNARKRRIREVESAQERERVADWLATYHRQVEELKRNGNPNQSGLDSG